MGTWEPLKRTITMASKAHLYSIISMAKIDRVWDLPLKDHRLSLKALDCMQHGQAELALA